MYMGRTSLSLTDIRQFNQLQNQIYRLHQNDCRWALLRSHTVSMQYTVREPAALCFNLHYL